MARFKTLQFPNTPTGQRQKIAALERETSRGWRVVSETIVPGKFKGSNACCLFLIFAPCAFLAGHENDVITVTLEKGVGAALAVKEPMVAEPAFDHNKWNALLRYDKAIASAAEKIAPLGPKWMDELASAYLSINDKDYLPEIVEGIFARAKVEQEDKARHLSEVAQTKALRSIQPSETTDLPRKISPVFGIGIFLMPFVFAWFTLRGGFSTTSRIVAFGWMMIALMIILASGTRSTDSAAVRTSTPQSALTNVAREVGPQTGQPTSEISSRPTQNRVGPSFECGTKMNQPLAEIICASDEMARIDLSYVIKYQALQQSLDERGRAALRNDANTFVLGVTQQCNIPRSGNFGRAPTLGEIACIKDQYELEQLKLLGRMSGDALEEAKLEPEDALMIQQALREKTFLPKTAPIDGLFGPLTRTALASWQRSVGLRETGYGSKAMLAKLAARSP